MNIIDPIRTICERIYTQLGSAHNECVYQKALMIELIHLGAISVEIEKHVPVFFVDSQQIKHTIGSERIDLYARFPIATVLFELKATTGCMKKSEHNQIIKYKESLHMLNETANHMILVNFVKHGTKIEFEIIND
tara:strand:+ start:120 stop:524 length:405 start_codon:yes stop_codon:yes gene_type:complete